MSPIKKAFLLLIISFIFNQTIAAQSRNGVRAIARYADTLTPPRLDPSDGLPEFEGGIDAFKAAFLKEFIFPAASLASEKGGEGVIGFTIDDLLTSEIANFPTLSPDNEGFTFSILGVG